MDDQTPLPIHAIQSQLMDALARSTVVLTAPTGSGKSTQIPRWCGAQGRVLVIEPRRVACRGLAQWVAHLEGAELGKEVGYAVREDHRWGPNTRILFATPGVVLRWWAADEVGSFDTVILDEFHERGMETDLLAALLNKSFQGRLIVMSATMDAAALGHYFNATHLVAQGRTYPVEIRHHPGDILQPDSDGLDHRVLQAISRAAADPGDVLVFLPGKAEIRRIAALVDSSGDMEVLEIHGGLSLREQSRVFDPGLRRRVILATNVAETSITIPRIGVVVDSGLVRRTRYFNGRGFLTLVPIALDSADQRAGRAGRTAPGICYRLWSPQASIPPITPPEIHREALSALLLAAAACGKNADELAFPDPPRPYAVQSAREDLEALGAIDKKGHITERGEGLFGMPLDPSLGCLLAEAQRSDCLIDAIDLVSALAVDRSIFENGPRPEDPALDLRSQGCDVVALVNAVRRGNPRDHHLNPHVLAEARALRGRLGKAFHTTLATESEPFTNRELLLRCAVRADRRCAYVARHRKGHVALGNGGPELSLARESAVDPAKLEAAIVLGTMAIGVGRRDSKILATCAAPVRAAVLAQEGLGVDRVSHVTRNRGTIEVQVERFYAGKVIEKREEIPFGSLARSAIAELFVAGRIFAADLACAQERLQEATLARELIAAGLCPEDTDLGAWAGGQPVPSLAIWAVDRLLAMGVQGGDDLGLLSPGDLLPPALPADTGAWMKKRFPLQVDLKDVIYQVHYDLGAREVTLDKMSGHRKQAPSPDTIPAFGGFRVKVKHTSRVWVLRDNK